MCFADGCRLYIRCLNMQYFPKPHCCCWEVAPILIFVCWEASASLGMALCLISLSVCLSPFPFFTPSVCVRVCVSMCVYLLWCVMWCVFSYKWVCVCVCVWMCALVCSVSLLTAKLQFHMNSVRTCNDLYMSVQTWLFRIIVAVIVQYTCTAKVARCVPYCVNLFVLFTLRFTLI